MMRSFFVGLYLLLDLVAHLAELPAQMVPRVTEIYPAPSASRVSPNWSLEVHDGAAWMPVPVLTFVRSPYPGWPAGAGNPGYVNNLGAGPVRVNWATLGLSHSARVRVRHLVSPLAVLEVVPDRVDPAAFASPGSVEFTVHRERQYFVRSAAHPNYQDTMFVFCNPPEAIDAASGQPLSLAWGNPITRPADVEYFGPGEHIVSTTSALGHPGTLDLNNGKRRVYLAPGAWVMGHIDVGIAASNSSVRVEVMGPGVLSGERDSHDYVRSNPGFPIHMAMITSRWWDYTQPNSNGMSNSVLVDGPTIVAGPFYSFMLTHVWGKKTIRNTHILSPWSYNTDSFQVGANAEIEACFSFNNDDTILAEYNYLKYPYAQGSNWVWSYKGISVKNCVFAGRTLFQAGYGYFRPDGSHLGTYTTVESCDVAFMLPNVWDLEEGLFAASVARWDSGEGNEVGNQIYRDIRVHGPVRRLFKMKIEVPSWASGSGAAPKGNLKNVVYENIKILDSHLVNALGSVAPVMLASEFNGIDSNNMMGYVEFRDIVVNRSGFGRQKVSANAIQGSGSGPWWDYFKSPTWVGVSWNFR